MTGREAEVVSDVETGMAESVIGEREEFGVRVGGELEVRVRREQISGCQADEGNSQHQTIPGCYMV